MKKEKKAECARKETRAMRRQKARILHLMEKRDFTAAWMQKTFDAIGKDALGKGSGGLSPLDRHLIRLEASALQQLTFVLNARIRYEEAKSRDANGDVVQDTDELELAFVRSPKCFSRKTNRKGEK